MGDEGTNAESQARKVWREALESVGEGRLADTEEMSLADAWRIQNKLARSVADSARPFVLEYSLWDIEKLTDGDRSEHTRLQSDWRKWHRELTVSTAAGIAWLTVAVLAWFLVAQSDSAGWRVLGWVLGGCLLLRVGRVFAWLNQGHSWDSYSTGYWEGRRAGVNSALRISPEREKEMWEELSEARIAADHLARGERRD